MKRRKRRKKLEDEPYTGPVDPRIAHLRKIVERERERIARESK